MLVAAVEVVDPTEMAATAPFTETNITPHSALLKVQEIAAQGVPHASRNGPWGTAAAGGWWIHGELLLLGQWWLYGELLLLRRRQLHGELLLLRG